MDVLPEDPTETYLDKDEVDHLISSFQCSLSSIIAEVESLKTLNEDLNLGTQSELRKKTALETEEETLRIQCQKETLNAQILTEQLELNSMCSANKVDLLQIETALDNGLPWDPSRTQNELELLKELKNTCSALSLQCGEYCNKLLEPRTCHNCKIVHIPAAATLDCIYHPGHLKFYSCKACGKAAYYNCCNKCKECSPGCRTATHLFD